MKIQKNTVNTSSNYFPLRALEHTSLVPGIKNEVVETPGNDLFERELHLIPQSDWHRERPPFLMLALRPGRMKVQFVRKVPLLNKYSYFHSV